MNNNGSRFKLSLRAPTDSVAEVRYRKLFETTRIGILILDFKTRIIADVNPFMIQLSGYPKNSRKKLVGKRLSHLKLFQKDVTGKRIFDALKNSNEVVFDDVIFVNRKGQKKIVEVIATLYEENGASAVQCNVRDLTEKRKVQQELFDSKQRLEALMNALPVGVTFSTDASCEHITGNPAILRELEMAPGANISVSTRDRKAPGRQLRHYIKGQLIDASDMPMQRAVTENREVGPFEIEVELPSGKRWFIEARGAPIRDEEGKVVAAVAVNVDLTERRRAEEASRLERFIEQHRLKNEFIADATHELRTPLAIIKGNVDLAIRSGTKDPEALNETFKAIDVEVMYLANLLSDLTLLTIKGRHIHRKIQTQTISLTTLVSDIVRRHKGFAHKKRISLNVENLPRATVLGDEPYLERLFTNIISNAISYGKEGGKVVVSGSKTAKEVTITVADDGIGISEQDLPKIFDRFYRAENSRSKDYGGSGLGLAIVKWIAEAHGGRVSVSSREGKGSTFTITLPLKQA